MANKIPPVINNAAMLLLVKYEYRIAAAKSTTTKNSWTKNFIATAE